MKKLFLLLTCFFVVLLSQVKAQEWISEHSEWTYWRSSFSPWLYPHTMYILSDTILADRHCKKSNIETSCPNAANGNNILFFHASNDSILFWDPIIEDFKLLYDFTKQEGESYQIYPLIGSFSDTLIVFIDSIRITNIDNKSIRVQYVTTESISQENRWGLGFMGKAIVMEYIGSTTYFYPQEWGYCDMNFTELCIFSDENIIYKIDEKDCTKPYYLNIVEEYLYDLVSIYPNPTIDAITINAPANCNVKIFNALGVCMIFFQMGINEQQTISLAQFPKGIYILQFQIAKSILNKKVIKL